MKGKKFLLSFVLGVILVSALNHTVLANEIERTYDIGENKTYLNLDEAVAKSKEDGATKITYNIYGKSVMKSSGGYAIGGENATDVKFIGRGSGAELFLTEGELKENSAAYIAAGNADVSFENLIINEDKMDNVADGHVYNIGFLGDHWGVWSSGKVSYKNCDFPEGVATFSKETYFSKCDFSCDTSDEYNLWAYQAAPGIEPTIYVDNCNFTGTRGVKLYCESGVGYTGSGAPTAVITNCTFDSLTEKPAVVASASKGFEISGNVYKNMTEGIYYAECACEIKGTDISKIAASAKSGSRTIYFDNKEYALAKSENAYIYPASINDKIYETLAEATTDAEKMIDDGAETVTIKLLSDVSLGNRAAGIEAKRDGIIYDLNNYSLILGGDHVFTKNTTFKNGNIKITDEVANTGVFWLWNSNNTITFENVNISNLGENINACGVFTAAPDSHGVVPTDDCGDFVFDNCIIDLKSNKFNSDSGGNFFYFQNNTSCVTIIGGTITVDGLSRGLQYGTYDINNAVIKMTNMNGNAIRRAKGIMKNSTFTVDGCENGIKFDNNNEAFIIEDSKISIKNPENKDVVLSNGGSLKLVSGYYSFDPTEYISGDKSALMSDEIGYAYTIGVKKVFVDTDVKPEKNKIEVSGDIGQIDEESFVVDVPVLSAAAVPLTNDPSVVKVSSGEATDILKNAGVIDNEAQEETKVTLVVQPYIEINVASGDMQNKLLSLEISAKYNVVATVASGEEEIVTSGDNLKKQNAVVISSGDTLEVKKPIEITIGLPVGFAEPNSKLYVRHIKETMTYVYEATVSSDGLLATFLNTHGFSSFEVSTENGVATNLQTGNTYIALADAISEVADGQTIKLLRENIEEQIEIEREITFTIDTTSGSMSGDFAVSSDLTVEKTESGNKVIYTYQYVRTEEPLPPVVTPVMPSKPKYTITVRQRDGGRITPGTIRVEEGENRIFKIVADEGYEISDVIVDGKSYGKIDRYTFENVEKTHVIVALYTKIENEWTNPYKDVGENDWYYEAVKFVTEKGLFNGMAEDEFGPEVTMTRGMLVTVLYRYAKAVVEEVSVFDDVDSNMYYSKPIAWAAKLGVVNGVGHNKFNPDSEITREQLATILYRYTVISKMDVSVGADTNILSYDDFNELSEYSIEAFQWACGSGIVNGRTESTLVPQGNAKRCEVATMIFRFCEKYKKI